MKIMLLADSNFAFSSVSPCCTKASKQDNEASEDIVMVIEDENLATLHACAFLEKFNFPLSFFLSLTHFLFLISRVETETELTSRFTKLSKVHKIIIMRRSWACGGINIYATNSQQGKINTDDDFRKKRKKEEFLMIKKKLKFYGNSSLFTFTQELFVSCNLMWKRSRISDSHENSLLHFPNGLCHFVQKYSFSSQTTKGRSFMNCTQKYFIGTHVTFIDIFVMSRAITESEKTTKKKILF